MGSDVPLFSTDLADPTFCDLFCKQLVDVPTVFFRQVRSSVRNLLCPPPPNASREYPQAYMVSSTSEDGVKSIRKLLQWDYRYGYSHWHAFYVDSSGFTVNFLLPPFVCS